jgi:hypothetical protein
MNERIKQLWEQAGDYVNETYTGPVRSKTPGEIWEDGHVGWHTQFNEKFAELIVRECVAVIEPGEFMQGTAHDDTKKIIALNQRKIRKHFGVDE